MDAPHGYQFHHLLLHAFLSLILLQLFGTSQLCLAAPVMNPEMQAMIYLQKYGYINEPIREQEVSYAIKEFQRFAGLAITGHLDSPTITMMNMPRCGVKEFVQQYGVKHLLKRSDRLPSGTNITYRISEYPSERSIDKETVDQEIDKAFKMWSDVSNVNFTKSDNDKVHIILRFESWEHGDGHRFEGPGRTLAHAFPPRYGGEVHFDSDETWTKNQIYGTNLFQVAVHQIGHSMGLFHSKVISSVMSPFYRRYDPTFRLDDDDIWQTTLTYGPSLHKTADVCKDSSIDAATTATDGHIYFFKGKNYWETSDSGRLLYGGPRRISDDWRGLPGYLDAALTLGNGTTLFFKKHLYWRFQNKTIDPGYPKKISDDFKGIPDDIDTAFVWSGNGMIYFFKDRNYWEFNPRSEPPVGVQYPEPISTWRGLPNNIDAAFQTNKAIYFFKGQEYYRVNDLLKLVDRSVYPLQTSVRWFNCQSESSSKESKGNEDVESVYGSEKQEVDSEQNIPLENKGTPVVSSPIPNMERSQKDKYGGEQPERSAFVDVCEDSSIDAATTTADGRTYLFKGDYYWEVSPSGQAEECPRRISDDWIGLPGNLDAAFTWNNGTTVFFKKHQYWMFENKIMISRFNNKISVGFKGIPDNIDAAIMWGSNDEIFFFKGHIYWEFKARELKVSLPRMINIWGLPNNIDAAIQWNNKEKFFFVGQDYYQYIDQYTDPPPFVSVGGVSSSYPLSSSLGWFNCPDRRSLKCFI